MTTRIVIGVIGLIYVVLGIWCALQPEQTSRTVGLNRQPGSGQSEFLTIYGGLQVGLGLAFMTPLIWAAFERPMLVSCLLVHAGIVAFRVISLVMYTGIPRTTMIFAAVEAAALVACIWRIRV